MFKSEFRGISEHECSKKYEILVKSIKNDAEIMVDSSKCHWIQAIWRSPLWLQDNHRKLKVEMCIPLGKMDYKQNFVDPMIGIQKLPQKSVF